MFVNITIMTPTDGHAPDLFGSMSRYGEAASAEPGLKLVKTFQGRDGELFGVAIWESEADAVAARPNLGKATEDDDFDAWAADIQNFRFTLDEDAR